MSPEHSGDTALKLGNVAKLGSGRVEIPVAVILITAPLLLLLLLLLNKSVFVPGTNC
jgi:hypothetical protein